MFLCFPIMSLSLLLLSIPIRRKSPNRRPLLSLTIAPRCTSGIRLSDREGPLAIGRLLPFFSLPAPPPFFFVLFSFLYQNPLITFFEFNFPLGWFRLYLQETRYPLALPSALHLIATSVRFWYCNTFLPQHSLFRFKTYNSGTLR